MRTCYATINGLDWEIEYQVRDGVPVIEGIHADLTPAEQWRALRDGAYISKAAECDCYEDMAARKKAAEEEADDLRALDAEYRNDRKGASNV